MRADLKDIVLSDAIEEYIKAERKIIKLEKELCIAWCCCAFFVVLCIIFKMGG